MRPSVWLGLLRSPLTRWWFRWRHGEDEWFEVFDEEGRPVTTAPRRLCHGRTFLRHRSVHLLVLDRWGRFLLQKRSMTKDTQPGRWDTSVGGHAAPGETPVESVLREAEEELGLRLGPAEVRFLYDYDWVSDREREWVHTFLHVTDREDFRHDPAEIEELRFWSAEAIEAAVGTGVFTPNFEHEFRLCRRVIG